MVSSDTGVAGMHLGHVHLKVGQLERSIDFYTDVLDLAVAERQGNFAFLSFGEHHHDLALQAVGTDAPGPGPGIGLYHAAFEVAEPAALGSVAEQLRERDVALHPVDHGISKALYFDDPDGNGLEVYVDTRAETGLEQWDGTNAPFDPESLG